MIRVLVADDSPTARELLAAIFDAEPDLEVVGLASDGREAVELTEKLLPDVISMDAQMPRMDGIEATRAIMARVPTPIVIVSASFMAGDVAASMQAIRAGALTVVHKPRGPGSPDFEAVARDVAQTIRTMSQVKVVKRWASSAAPPPSRREPVRRSNGARPEIIALAASTGGPAALSQILRDLPASFGIPILVVQHIAIGFAAGFAAWLDSLARLDVKVAEDGEALGPGTVLIAPDDAHLEVADRHTVAVRRGPPIGGFRPSASHMFESVGRVFGARALGVVLTGMGRDGLEGVRELFGAGGQIIAQDKATSVVFGMPGVVVEADLATSVLPLPAIAAHLAALR